jgi:hypothetical protein
MVLEPVGVLMVIVDEVSELGIVALEAQSQYGIRKLSAAAWYVARFEVGYCLAMVWVLFQRICSYRER